MKLIFDKKLLPKHARRDNLECTYPQMFIFVKEENNLTVVCGVESKVGSQREIPEDKNYSESFFSKTTAITKEASLSIEKGATHMITGYFNLIQDKWVEYKTYELANIDKDSLNKIFDEVLKKQYNEMYTDKELFIENLKFKTKNQSFSYGHEQFDHVNLFSVFEYTQDYYKNNKHETHADGSISLFNMINDAKSHFGIEKNAENYFLFIKALESYHIAEVGYFNIATKEFDYEDGRLGLIDVSNCDFSKTYPVPVCHKRFLETQK